ncbi:MAG: response regulator [Deltaproteobacteria bacterium]|nr:response regulator [Deltaproteobacteria bacterium]
MMAAHKRLRILLAEDDDDMRASLADFLCAAGFEVAPVSNGTEMLEALSLASEVGPDAPDVIITDVIMPGFSGINVIEELRAEGWRQPILVISGFDPTTVSLRVERLRDVRFLPKPLDPPQVLAVVAELCGPSIAGA